MQWLGPPDLKFGISEKHTKFKKIFLMVLTNQLIYLVKNHEEDFFKSCVLLKKSKLYARGQKITCLTYVHIIAIIKTQIPNLFYHVNRITTFTMSQNVLKIY